MKRISTLSLDDVRVEMQRILDPTPVEELLRLRIPHDKQDLIIKSKAKRKIIRAGRRAGKTTVAGSLAVEAFQQGRRILYGVPTQEQVERFWYEVTEALRGAIDVGRYHKNETSHSIELLGTRQRIRAKTCWDANTLRGDDADLLILDEFQLMNEDAWGVVGAPMLIDNDGDAVFIYTPPSLRSKSTTKASDPQHAAKMFKRALKDMEAAKATGKQSRWEAFHFTSHDNPYLSKQALAEISMDMTTSAIRQEIMAEDTEEIPGALWKREMIDPYRVRPDQVPQLEVIVVGVDPPGSDKTECGIVASGRGRSPLGTIDDGRKHMYVLEDASMLAPTSKAWAQRAVNVYFEHKADRLIGERNYGGDMVEGTIRQAENGEAVSYSDANATRGKIVRAEPVAAAYERGVVHHVGEFPELEDELCSYVPGNKSPNRFDACVWTGLRLLEGMDTLGLIDYLSSGRAQEDMKAMEKVQRASTLIKPMVPEEAPACPECQSACVIQIAGGEMHCNGCGVQWKVKGGNRNPFTMQPMSRGAYLERERR